MTGRLCMLRILNSMRILELPFVPIPGAEDHVHDVAEIAFVGQAFQGAVGELDERLEVRCQFTAEGYAGRRVELVPAQQGAQG